VHKPSQSCPPDVPRGQVRRRQPLLIAGADRFRTCVQELARGRAPSSVGIDADAVHLTDTDGAEALNKRRASCDPGCVVRPRRGPPADSGGGRGVIERSANDAVFETVYESVDALLSARARSVPDSRLMKPLDQQARRGSSVHSARVGAVPVLRGMKIGALEALSGPVRTVG
jgi:hypothetical protein